MNPVYIVGVDGSSCSNRAIDFTKERARTSGGCVLVAYVIEWSQFTFSTPQENEVRHKRREEELLRAQTDVVGPVVDRLIEDGVDAKGLTRHGHVAETINKLAMENDALYIIIGRKGTSRLKTKIFGSVASTLVQIADRPVCVVP